MIHQATETARGGIPVFNFGPGGMYTEKFFARGRQILPETKPAPPAPPTWRLKASRRAPTAATSWRWLHLFKGLLLSPLAAFALFFAAPSFPIFLAILPLLKISRKTDTLTDNTPPPTDWD